MLFFYGAFGSAGSYVTGFVLRLKTPAIYNT
jgi:hypothetical protein